MAKKGLTREVIIDAAQELLAEKGMPGFSLRALAALLDVQVSSLYNHISGQNELLTEVGLRAVDMLAGAERRAIEGLSGDEALYALAEAYRAFALTHVHIYRLIMGAHTLSLPELEDAAMEVSEPILEVLSGYGVEGEELINCQRALRSVMHGFFAHEHHGGFSHADVDRNESYRFAVECIALRIKGERNG